MVKGLEKPTGYVSTWSYAGFNEEIENYTIVGNTYKFNNLNISIGAGMDSNFKTESVIISPTIEGKVKYNLGKGFSTQIRGRAYGDENKKPVFQARATLSKEFKSPVKKLTPYAAVHITDKVSSKGHNLKTGGWLGISYKACPNLSFSAELQQNVSINNPSQWTDKANRFLNLGASWSF